MHCPSIKRKMTASFGEDSIPDFSHTYLLLIVSMKQYSGVDLSLIAIALVVHFSHFLICRSASSAEFPEKHVPFLHEKDLKVQRVKMNSAVQGILKNKNAITAIAPPQSSDLIVLLTT